jgi:hypothetical protein
MKYGEIITRALAISWRHKYLWLLAIFAGEGALGLSLPSIQRPGQNVVSYKLPATDWNRFTDWASSNAGWLWAAGAACLVLWIVLFLVSVPANAALIKGGAAHDGGQPYRLGQAWRAGFSRFWPVLGIKAFTVLVGITSVIVIGGLFALAALYGMSGSYGLSALAGVLGAIVLLAAIPFWIVFTVVVALAIRAAVLDGRSPSAAFADGFGLVRRRFGRVALMYVLIGIAGMVAGLAVGLVAAVLLVPLAGIVIAAYAAGGTALAIGTGIVLALPWLAVVVAVSGGVSAFTSTCWTLSYTRFDLESQPAGRTAPAAV